MTASPFDLTGRTAIVTGSTRGIGFAIARGLCEAGARCIVSSESAEDTDAAVKRLKDEGCDVFGVKCDVTDPAQNHALIEVAKTRFDRLDILICNAGITGKPGPIENADKGDDRHVFDVNLHSMISLTGAAYPVMKTQGSGSIILMSSIAGIRGNKNINAYAMAKAGVAQLARNLAVQWGPDGIRANVISPGLIKTPLSDPLISDKEFVARRLQMTPLRRIGETRDVVGAALFLASDAAAFVTGHNLVVDGGTVITDGS